jgi:hypothetical protein
VECLIQIRAGVRRASFRQNSGLLVHSTGSEIELCLPPPPAVLILFGLRSHPGPCKLFFQLLNGLRSLTDNPDSRYYLLCDLRIPLLFGSFACSLLAMEEEQIAQVQAPLLPSAIVLWWHG